MAPEGLPYSGWYARKAPPVSLLPPQAALLGEESGKGEPRQTGGDTALWLWEKQKKDAAASFFIWL